ncbi:hypothetical protein HY489_03025 [Candidatus Woesearchaeota archaeon]|nr:hypothetical protein [Candidatus Woesearchaeota archaeon]
MRFTLEFDLLDLASFLLRARNQSYAGMAEPMANPQRPGFKEFPPYHEGSFEYLDSYAGNYYAPGQEVVRYKGKPVWNMAYNGGMLPEHHGNRDLSQETYAFLKKALQRVELARPFRGPARFAQNNFEYIDQSEGDITNFKGTERILHKGQEVFRQDYIGGLIVHK